jgi:hypothetical protein
MCRKVSISLSTTTQTFLRENNGYWVISLKYVVAVAVKIMK